MRISNEPQQTEVPHLSGNTRVNVWVALLVMDDEQDTSLTTGWYWRLADMGAAENERHDDHYDVVGAGLEEPDRRAMEMLYDGRAAYQWLHTGTLPDDMDPRARTAGKTGPTS